MFSMFGLTSPHLRNTSIQIWSNLYYRQIRPFDLDILLMLTPCNVLCV